MKDINRGVEVTREFPPALGTSEHRGDGVCVGGVGGGGGVVRLTDLAACGFAPITAASVAGPTGQQGLRVCDPGMGSGGCGTETSHEPCPGRSRPRRSAGWRAKRGGVYITAGRPPHPRLQSTGRSAGGWGGGDSASVCGGGVALPSLGDPTFLGEAW